MPYVGSPGGFKQIMQRYMDPLVCWTAQSFRERFGIQGSGLGFRVQDLGSKAIKGSLKGES